MPDDNEITSTQEGQAVSGGDKPAIDIKKAFTPGQYEQDVQKHTERLNSLVSGMRNMPEFKNWKDDEIIKEVAGAFHDNDKDAINSLVTSLAQHDPAYADWDIKDVAKNVFEITSPVLRRGLLPKLTPQSTQPASPAQAPGDSTSSAPAATTPKPQAEDLKRQYGALVNEVDAISAHPEFTDRLKRYNELVTKLNTPSQAGASMRQDIRTADGVTTTTTTPSVDAGRVAIENELKSMSDVPEAAQYIQNIHKQLTSIPEEIRQQYHEEEAAKTPPKFDKALAKKYLDYLSDPGNAEKEVQAKGRGVANMQEGYAEIQDKKDLLQKIVDGEYDQYSPPSPTMNVLGKGVEALHMLLPGPSSGMPSPAPTRLIDTQLSQTERLQKYANEDVTMKDIVKSVPTREPKMLENIVAGAVSILPALPSLAAATKMVVGEIPALGAIAKGGIPRTMGAALAKPGQVAGFRVLTGSEEAMRLTQNILTATARGALAFPLQAAMVGEKPGLKQAGAGAAFESSQAIVSALTESLPLPLRTGKLLAPMVQAFAGGLGFSGGGALGAAITGQPIPNLAEEFGKGALLSVVHTFAGKVMERVGQKDPKLWSSGEQQIFAASAALRGARSEGEYEQMRAAMEGAGDEASFTDKPKQEFSPTLKSKIEEMSNKPKSEWTPEDIELFRDVTRYSMEKTAAGKDEILEALNEKYTAETTETTPTEVPPEQGGVETPPSPATPPPTPTKPVEPVTPGAVETGEKSLEEPTEYAKQNYKEIVEAAKEVGIYDTIAKSLKEGKSVAEIAKIVADNYAPVDNDVIHAVAIAEKELTQPGTAPAVTPEKPAGEVPAATPATEPPIDEIKRILSLEGFTPGWIGDRTDDELRFKYNKYITAIAKHGDNDKALALAAGYQDGFSDDVYKKAADNIRKNFGQKQPATLPAVIPGDTGGGKSIPGPPAPKPDKGYQPKKYTSDEFLQSALTAIAKSNVKAFSSGYTSTEGVFQYEAKYENQEDALKAYDALVENGFEVEAAPYPGGFHLTAWKADALPASKVGKGPTEKDFQLPKPVEPEKPAKQEKPAEPEKQTEPPKPTPIGSGFLKYINQAILPDAKKDDPTVKPDSDKVLRRAMIEMFDDGGFKTLLDAEDYYRSIAGKDVQPGTNEYIEALKDAITLAYARPGLIGDMIVIPGNHTPDFTPEIPKPKNQPKQKPKPVPKNTAEKPTTVPGNHPADPEKKAAKKAADKPAKPESPDVPPAPTELSANPTSDPNVLEKLPDAAKQALDSEADNLDKLFGGGAVSEKLADAFFNRLEGRRDVMDPETFFDNNRITKSIDDTYDFSGKGLTLGGMYIRALGIADQLQRRRTVDLLGAVVRTSYDIAKRAQIFRDARFETVRYTITDDKGEVVWTFGVTSGVPGTTAAFPEGWDNARMKAYLQEVVDNLIATGKNPTTISLFHNHPSGNVQQSTDDVVFTKNLIDNVLPTALRFGSHVVIDWNKYTTIRKTHEGKLAASESKAQFNPEGMADPLKVPTIDHPILGKKLDGPGAAAELAATLVHDKDFAVIFAVSRSDNPADKGSGLVKSVADMPKTMLFDPGKKAVLREHLKSYGFVAGSNQLIVAGLEAGELGKVDPSLITDGFLQDVVDNNGNGFYESMPPVAQMMFELQKGLTGGLQFGEKPWLKGQIVKQNLAEYMHGWKDSAAYKEVTAKPEFKKWFEGSAVVDKEGKPLVAYHGTGMGFPFDWFKSPFEIGPHFGTIGQAEERINATTPAMKDVPVDSPFYEDSKLYSNYPNIYPVFLNIKRPLTIPDIGTFTPDDVLSVLVAKQVITENARRAITDSTKGNGTLRRTKTVELLQSLGYDGLRYINTGEAKEENEYSFVALQPNQVKSATGNGGQFDPRSSFMVAEERPKYDAIDEAFYQKAKPSFETIRKAMAQSNVTIDRFIDALVAKYGERIRPYANRFAREFADDESFKGGLAGAESTGRLGTFKRPSVLVVNGKNLPIPRNNVPAGRYDIDEQQRLGVNLALDRIAIPGAAFLLADGAGTGKTREELVIAQETFNKTGKPSLIITQNQQIVSTSFANDAAALKIKLGTDVEVITYDNMKSKKGGTGQYGVVIFDEAHNLKNVDSDRSFLSSLLVTDNKVFATATPMDNAHNAAYFMALVTGRTEEDIQHELGYNVEWKIDQFTQKPRPFAYTLPGVSWHQVYENIRTLRNDAIARGAMIRREYPFYGRISSSSLNMDVKDIREQNMIFEYWQEKINEAYKPAARRNFAGQRTFELSRWIETKKTGAIFDMMKRDLDDGKQVIIVAEGVEESVNKALSFHASKEIKIPGFISVMADKLDKAGIRYSRVYGGGNKAKEVDKFQSGNTKVLLMTPKSGGAGINLDDTVGDAPRSMYIATANFGADVLDQMLYRASRRTTKSPVDLKFIYSNGSISDKRRSDLVTHKFKILRNIQAGEDPDTTGISYELSTNVEEKMSQMPGAYFRRTPPGMAGAAQNTQIQRIATLGSNVANAWKGHKYEVVDGLSAFVAKPAYDVIMGGRKMAHYLGLPQFIGEHIPELKKVFVALKNVFHEANERFADVRDVLQDTRDRLKPTVPEKAKVAMWAYRGNDRDVQRYFTRGETLIGLPGLGLPAMTAREADVYERLVFAQGLGTAITKDAMKYFMMSFPLSDEEFLQNNWGRYDVASGRWLIPPPLGSMEERIVASLTPAELNSMYTAIEMFRRSGNITNPNIRADWNTLKAQFQEPVVDKIVKVEVERLGGYQNLQRHGDYYVSWKEPGSNAIRWNQYELESEAAAERNRRIRSGMFTDVSAGLVSEPGFLSRFIGKDLSLAELMVIVDKMGLEDSPDVQRLVNEWKKAGFKAHSVKRKYVEGYERTYDNLVRGIHDYGQGASRHYMRTKGRIDAMAIMKTIDTENFPYHAKLVSDFVQGYFAKADNSGQFLRKIVYVSNLAWSATFTIQQIFQQLITHFGPLSQEVGIHKSPIILASANAYASSYMVGATGALPAELVRILDRAERRESTAGSMIEELAAAASRHGGHLYAPKTTGLLVNLGVKKETVQTGVRTLETALEFAGGVTEKYNRILGVAEAYQMGIDKGLTGEELYQYCEQWTARVNLEYTKLNIPIFVNKSDMARPIARSFYTFMSFQFGAIHLAFSALRKTDKGLYKWLSGIVATLVGYTLSAGILQVPLGDMLTKLYKWITGDTESPDRFLTKNESIPEWARKIMDAGILSLLGMDMRRSLGAGDVNPLDVSKLVPFQVVKRGEKAVEEFQKGNILKGMAKSPVGVIPPLRGVARMTEAQRYGYGYGSRTLVAPQDLSSRDLLMLGANITPYKVGKEVDVQSQRYELMEERRKEYSAIVEHHARGVISNDQARVDESIDRLTKYNEKVIAEGFPQLAVDFEEYGKSVELKLHDMVSPGSTGSSKTRSLDQELRDRGEIK